MARSAFPPAPRHLTRASQEWWRVAVREYELERHHLELLSMALEHRDRARQARAALAKHGLVFEDRFGQPRPRPEAAIARDSSIACARLLREIGLDADIPEHDPRLPRRAR